MERFEAHDQATVPISSIPGYMEWSERRLAAGESPTLMATLDAQHVTVRPEDAPELDESYFDGMLEALREQAG